MLSFLPAERWSLIFVSIISFTAGTVIYFYTLYATLLYRPKQSRPCVVRGHGKSFFPMTVPLFIAMPSQHGNWAELIFRFRLSASQTLSSKVCVSDRTFHPGCHPETSNCKHIVTGVCRCLRAVACCVMPSRSGTQPAKVRLARTKLTTGRNSEARTGFSTSLLPCFAVFLLPRCLVNGGIMVVRWNNRVRLSFSFFLCTQAPLFSLADVRCHSLGKQRLGHSTRLILVCCLVFFTNDPSHTISPFCVAPPGMFSHCFCWALYFHILIPL